MINTGLTKFIESINRDNKVKDAFIIQNFETKEIMYMDITDMLGFWVQPDFLAQSTKNRVVELENGMVWNDTARSGQYITLFKGKLEPGINKELLKDTIDNYSELKIPIDELTFRDIIDCRSNLSQIDPELAVNLLIHQINNRPGENHNFRYDKYLLNVIKLYPDAAYLEETKIVANLLKYESNLIRDNFSYCIKKRKKKKSILEKITDHFK